MTVWEYQTVNVRAKRYQAYQEKEEKVKTGTRTVEKPAGLLGNKTKMVEEAVYETKVVREKAGEPSRHMCDDKKLAEDMQDALNKLGAEGFEVIAVTPVIRGDQDWAYETKVNRNMNTPGWGYGYGYGMGWSYTEGVIITAKRQKQG